MQEKMEYKYDAFISYRHISPDAEIAETLHRLLEHYHIPKKLREKSGKKTFHRVFRDKEELPLSSDLSENIFDALSSSEFLILICSPSALESLWVQKEVSEFVRLRGIENIITIVSDGEPKTVFPDIICHKKVTYVDEEGKSVTLIEDREPLAADVRSKSTRECIRKLKTEYLRVVATMLDTGYDDIYHRHQRYKMRRILSAVSAAAVLAGGFGVYSSMKNMALQKQYQIIAEKESRHVSENAIQMLKEGDRTGALEAMRSILPDDPSKHKQGPVPEELYALNQILYTYRHNGSKLYAPLHTIHLLGVSEGEACLSEDQGKIICSDDSGHISILFGDDFGSILDLAELGEFLWYGFIDNTHVVLGGTTSMITIGLDNPDEWIRTSYISEGKGSSHSLDNTEKFVYCISPYYIVIASLYGNCIDIYPVVDSIPTDGFEVDCLNNEFGSIDAITVSDDGKYIAAASSVFSFGDGLQSTTTSHIQVFDTKDFSVVSKIPCGVVFGMNYIDDNNLAVTYYTEMGDDSDNIQNMSFLMYFDRYYKFEIYDFLTGELKYSSEPRRYTTSYEIQNTGVVLADIVVRAGTSAIPCIVFFCHDYFYILERETLKVLQTWTFEAGIISGWQGRDGTVYFMLDDGSVYSIEYSILVEILKIDSPITAAVYSLRYDKIVQFLARRDETVVSAIPVDAEMELTDDNPNSNLELELDDGETAVGKASDLKAIFDGDTISVISLTTGDELSSYHVTYSDGLIFDFFREDEYLIIYDARPHITIINSHNGHVVCDTYPGFEFIYHKAISSDKTGKYIAFNAESGTVQISDKGMKSPVLYIMICSDDFKLFPYASLPWGNVDFEKMKIYSWDREEEMFYVKGFYTFEELCEKAYVLHE